MYHKECLLNAQHLLSVDDEKVDSVELHLDKSAKAHIAENRCLVVPVIETVILCGRQGLPHRGHRDSVLSILPKNLQQMNGLSYVTGEREAIQTF